jgi:radical SAM superfamily enzyme YgiQ (UPF0313 family)
MRVKLILPGAHRSDDDQFVFDRTTEWAVQHGIETATFHILTPYPGTALHQRLTAEGRITVHDWDRYDRRHAVFRPARMSGEELERADTGAPIATSIAGDRSRERRRARRPRRRAAPCGLRRGMEEVRAALGSRDPHEARGHDVAGPRDDPQ